MVLRDRDRRVQLAFTPQFSRVRIALVLGCIAVVALAYLYAPYANRGPVVCPLRGIVGLACPTCGLTRALCALVARLDFAEAVRQNALSVPAAIFLLVAPWVALYELITGRRCAFYSFLLSVRVGCFVGAVMVIYHVSRVALDASLRHLH